MADTYDADLAEEIETFNALSEADRRWICFCLDVCEQPPQNLDVWMGKPHVATVTAAIDLLGSGVAVFRRDGLKKLDYRLGADAYPELIRAGAFVVQFGVCTSYRAFQFLFERMFGGEARPFIPSVYLAVVAHPSFSRSCAISHEEIEEVLTEHRIGADTSECLFRPTLSSLSQPTGAP